MALFRSSRRLSLKTILRDATVMLAGTVLGILLSHMFFADNKSASERGLDLETLCASSSNAPLPHLAKRSDDKLRHLRSRLVQNQMHVPPRPLPAVWGPVMSKSEVATGRESEGETLAVADDSLEDPASGSGADGGSGHPQVSTEDSSPQTTG